MGEGGNQLIPENVHTNPTNGSQSPFLRGWPSNNSYLAQDNKITTRQHNYRVNQHPQR